MDNFPLQNRPLLATPWEATAGLVLGWTLLSLGFRGDLALLLLALPPGSLALAASVGLLLWRGDSRLVEMLTLAVAATVLPLIGLLVTGQVLLTLAVLGMAVLVWIAAGRISIATYPQVAGVAEPEADLPTAIRIGTDQALLGWFKILMQPPRQDDRLGVLEELRAWDQVLGNPISGALLDSFHVRPPDLLRVESRQKSLFGQRYRHIHWDSDLPASDLPGAARWAEHARNRRAHAWVLEHPGKPRPWLLTIHGYRMGNPLMDLRAFEPHFLHQKLGLNIASVVLPLHGPRRNGVFSGGGYLEGDFSGFIHAQRQAIWDIRRLLSWIRLNRHAPAVGAYGISLGGYNASLLAGIDEELACVIAGIPVFDMALTMWRHMPAEERQQLECEGVHLGLLRQVFAPVSPGCFGARLSPDRLGIFAGTADTLVWPDQPQALAAHWGCRAPYWYSGAHLSFAGTPAQQECLRDTLARGKLL